MYIIGTCIEKQCKKVKWAFFLSTFNRRKYWICGNFRLLFFDRLTQLKIVAKVMNGIQEIHEFNEVCGTVVQFFHDFFLNYFLESSRCNRTELYNVFIKDKSWFNWYAYSSVRDADILFLSQVLFHKNISAFIKLSF